MILYLFYRYTRRGFITTSLYLCSIFLLCVFLQNLPTFLIEWLFPPMSDSVIDELDQEIFISAISSFHQLFIFLDNIHQSLFVRFDILTISGLLSLVLGFFILVQSFPLYIIFHFFILIFLTYNTLTVRALFSLSKKKIKSE